MAKTAPKNTSRYTYPDGYAGITNNPKVRAGEHRRAGGRVTMKVIGPRVTRKSAFAWERNRKKRR